MRIPEIKIRRPFVTAHGHGSLAYLLQTFKDKMTHYLKRIYLDGHVKSYLDGHVKSYLDGHIKAVLRRLLKGLPKDKIIRLISH